MAFSHPHRHVYTPHPDIILLIIAVLFALLSLWVVTVIERLPKHRPLRDSAIVQQEVPVYFTKSRGMQNTTEATLRALPVETATSSLQIAIQSLLKGPTAEEMAAGYYSEIPQGTRLLGITIQGNIVTVNLSEEFASGGGANSMIQRVEELKRTVTGFNKAYQLKIAINGKTIEYLGGEGLELN